MSTKKKLKIIFSIVIIVFLSSAGVWGFFKIPQLLFDGNNDDSDTDTLVDPAYTGIALYSPSITSSQLDTILNDNASKTWYLVQATTSDPVQIRNQIIKAHDDFPDIRYLLILGSENTIPIEDTTSLVLPYHPQNGASNAVLDSFYYGDLDGDHFIDLGVGRIPFDTIDIIEDYYSRSVPSYSATYLSIPEMEFKASHCLADNLDISIMKSASIQDAVTALDNGGIIGFENHGGPDAWELSDGYLSSDDVQNLPNSPIILTAACNSSSILGKDLIRKGAVAYFGSWFEQPGRDVVDPIYRKLSEGTPFGIAIKEYLNQQLSEFTVKSSREFIAADEPSFETISIEEMWDQIRSATGTGNFGFSSGALLFGDPSITFPTRLSNTSSIEQTAQEIAITLPDYLFEILPELAYSQANMYNDHEYVLCSSNRNNFYQFMYTTIPEFPAQNQYPELPLLAFQVDPSWKSISSGTWVINTQSINVPSTLSNGFASLVKGKSQSYLLINDHLLGEESELGQSHRITIEATKE